MVFKRRQKGARRSLKTVFQELGVTLYEFFGYVAYRIMRVLSLPVIKLLFGLEVRNPHCIPRQGPIILAANHHSILDPWVLQMAFPRRITYMVGDIFYKGRGWWFYRMHNAIPIREGALNKDAFVTGLRVLKENGVLAIFPEGWGNGSGEPWQGSPGVALLSAKSNVPVLPAHITGAQEALPKGAFLPRFVKIIVSYGEPIRFNGTEKPDREALRKMTDMIMERIKGLA